MTKRKVIDYKFIPVHLPINLTLSLLALSKVYSFTRFENDCTITFLALTWIILVVAKLTQDTVHPKDLS